MGYDSYFYLGAAQNVTHGLGLSRLSPDGQTIPLTHYPPLYSLVVAGFSYLLGGDIFLSARWTAILVYGVIIFLAGALGYRYARSSLAGLSGALLGLVSPVLLPVTISAFSEGLFIVLLLLSWFLLAEALGELEPRRILAAALVTALCCLTRYVGTTLVLAGGIAILFLNTQPVKKKIQSALLFGGASLIPLGVWYVRNWIVSGTTTNRTLIVHLPGREDVVQALNTVTAWILPETWSIRVRLAAWVVLLLLLLTMAALWAVLWSRRLRAARTHPLDDPSVRFVLWGILFTGVYLFSLVVAHTLFDASTRWETRILSPLYLVGVLVGIVVIWNGARLEGFRWTLFPWAAVLLFMFVVSIPASIHFLNLSRIEGEGFTSPAWKNSQTMRALKEFPTGSPVYTNNATAVYFVLGRVVYAVPERYDSVKDQARPEYAANLDRMRQQLQQPNSALVIFQPYRNAPEYPPLEELTEGLVVYEKTNDGTIYVSPGQTP